MRSGIMAGGGSVNITRYKGRFWALIDSDGTLICVTVYRKGAEEVKRRLSRLSA